MFASDPNAALIAELRGLVAAGSLPAEALRAILRSRTLEGPRTLALVKALKGAFCLTLHEASPVGGWNADGSGELSDERLNSFLIPHIDRRRDEWSALT